MVCDGAHVLDDEVLFKLFEEFGGREAVEVAHHAVVVDNFEVGGGEGHGEEVVVFLVALVVGIEAGFLVSDEGGGGGAVVSVGDVEIRNLVEGLGDAVDERVVVNHPESMAEAVGSDEVIFGLAGRDGLDYLVEVAVVGEGEEHRLDVGVLYAHVFHAVFLLVAAGELVLLDDAVHVVVDVGGHDNAVLGAAVHGLRVYIIMFLVVLYEPAFVLEGLEVLDCLVVDLGVVLVGAVHKVNLGLYDMVERAGIAFGLGTGFLGVEHVVGARCHLFDKLAGRTHAAERFYFCHRMFFS